MKIRFLTLALICMAVAAGCATTKNYERLLDTWVGDTDRHLIESWGVPKRVYESGGTKWLTYVKRDVYQNPYSVEICETTFEVEGGKIRRWTHKGDGCTMF